MDEEGEAWEWYSRLVETGVRNLRPLFFQGRAAFVGGAPSAYTVLRDFPGLVVNCQGQKFLGPHRLQHFLLILPYSKEVVGAYYFALFSSTKASQCPAQDQAPASSSGHCEPQLDSLPQGRAIQDIAEACLGYE